MDAGAFTANHHRASPEDRLGLPYTLHGADVDLLCAFGTGPEPAKNAPSLRCRIGSFGLATHAAGQRTYDDHGIQSRKRSRGR